MIINARLALEEGRVAQVYQKHGTLISNYEKAGIKGTPNASIKFSQFRKDNASLIADIRTKYASNLLKWDPTPKTKNLRKILNQSVPTKGTTFQGGIKGYVNTMMKVGEAGIYLKKFGYFSIRFDAVTAVREVNNAKEGETRRTAVVEGAKLSAGLITGSMTTALIIGLATGGTGLFVPGIVAIASVGLGKATSDLVGAGAAYDLIENNSRTK